jgi:hypothetical protein
MVTVSPGWNPDPQNLRLDPAAGAALLTDVAGAVTYGAALAGTAKATIAMITPNITVSVELKRLLVGMSSPHGVCRNLDKQIETIPEGREPS